VFRVLLGTKEIILHLYPQTSSQQAGKNAQNTKKNPTTSTLVLAAKTQKTQI